ncbi:MAG: enoyl-CoA hydratase-related protein, partial [Pseudomonadota bacterium]
IDNTLLMGIPGVEWFAHPMELGARRAKELLFSGDPISAEHAYQLGMVNRVVKVPELDRETLNMARQFAQNNSFALKLAKEAVNNFEDARGRKAAMESAFLAHQLAHAHARELFGVPIDPRRIDPKILAGTKYEQNEK